MSLLSQNRFDRGSEDGTINGDGWLTLFTACDGTRRIEGAIHGCYYEHIRALRNSSPRMCDLVQAK